MAQLPNPDNRYIASLRALRTRTERERTGTFYIEGARIVAQALKTGAPIEMGVVAPDLIQGEFAANVVAGLRALNVPMVELTPAAFGSISFKENLQGIGAVVRPRSETLANIDDSEGLGWVALDAVGNPGNLGAILRTTDSVGCAGLILLGDTTDPYHPAALRASMGAVFSQRLVRANFAEFVRWKEERHHPVVGTSGEGEVEYRHAMYPSPMVLLMGSERLGLSAEQQAVCDLIVRIPMVGTSDSLNLGVATSVVLYEIFYQHRARVLE